MIDPEKNPLEKGAENSSEIEEFTLSEYADTIIAARLPAVSNDPTARVTVGWSNDACTHVYELSRYDSYEKPKQAPVTVYRLTVVSTNATQARQYFGYRSDKTMAVTCDDKWNVVKVPKKDAEVAHRSMLDHLKTANLNPKHNPYSTTAMNSLLRIYEMEFEGRQYQFRRPRRIGRVFKGIFGFLYDPDK